MHVLYRRTYSMDVRDSTTYVFGTTRLENEIRDYASGAMDSGLRSRKSRMRDNAGFRVRRTFGTLDLVEEDRRGLIMP